MHVLPRGFGCALLLIAAGACAQERDPVYGIEAEMLTTTPGNTPHASDLAYDANHDGKLSRDEVKPGSNLAARFDRRDANHDGFLTQDEYFMPPGSGGNGEAPPAWWHPD